MPDHMTTHYTLADMKGRHLTETGYEIEGVYRLAGWVKRRALDGQTYIQLRLADLSGHMECYGWLRQLQQTRNLGYCDLVYVKGQLREYRGETVADLDVLETANTLELDNQPLLNTLPLIICPIPNALLELAGLIDSIEHPGLRALVREVLEIPTIAPAFVTASSHHAVHAYPGGLLQHTLDMVRTLHTLPMLSTQQREIAMVAGLLHDIGRIWIPQQKEIGQLVNQESLTLEACATGLLILSNEYPAVAETLRHILTQPPAIKPIRQKGMTALVHAVQMADWLSAENHPELPINQPVLAQTSASRSRFRYQSN